MRETDGARGATAEHPATPTVAPRFARAAEAERSRLEGKREQLLRKRETAEAELARIDRAVSGIDELLELLAPLLTGNGSEVGAAGDDSTAAADRGETAERDRVLAPDQRQPAKG